MTPTTQKAAKGVAALAAAVAALALAAPLAEAAPNGQTCTQTTVQSPYAGWVFVTDDQGVQWLEPTGIAPAYEQTCTTAADAVVQTSAVAGVAATSSPYPGWIVVTDDQGVPWLVQTGQTIQTHNKVERPASRARRHRSHSLR